MKYTVRFAHLKEPVSREIGDTFKRKDLVGIMGTTGKSTGVHLHIDCIEGERALPWRQSDMEEHKEISAIRQLNHFIDDELLEGEALRISTFYADPTYMKRFGLVHSGYDLTHSDHRPDCRITWNRSMYGTLLSKGYDTGYGNYIHVSFEA